MELVKLFCFLFMLANIGGMPIEKTHESTISIDWEKNICVCGSDLIDYMDIICKIKYSSIDDGHNTTQIDFQKLATECCENVCKPKTIKMFCGNKSATTITTTTPKASKPKNKKIITLADALKTVYNYTYIGLLINSFY